MIFSTSNASFLAPNRNCDSIAAGVIPSGRGKALSSTHHLSKQPRNYTPRSIAFWLQRKDVVNQRLAFQCGLGGPTSISDRNSCSPPPPQSACGPPLPWPTLKSLAATMKSSRPHWLTLFSISSILTDIQRQYNNLRPAARPCQSNEPFGAVSKFPAHPISHRPYTYPW